MMPEETGLSGLVDHRSPNLFRPALEITTVVGCSNACSYCPQDVLLQCYPPAPAPRVLRMDDFQVCLDKVPRDVRIDFSGMAEPWLHPECTSMVLHAHRTGFTLSVYTTTVGMSADDVATLEQIPFSHFVVHLPSAADRSRIRPDRVRQCVERLKHSRISMLQFRSLGDPDPALLEIVGTSVKRIRLSSRAGNLRLPRLAGTGAPLGGATQPSPGTRIRCSRVAGTVIDRNVMLPNGDVVLCCMDYRLQHRLGNLLEDSYRQLFVSREYARVQSGLSQDSHILCRSCEAAKPAEEGLAPAANAPAPGHGP